MQNALKKLYPVIEWVIRFVYLNLLWYLFTLGGLVIFGIAPSTVSMFEVTNRWVSGETDTKIFNTFWQTYKKEFLKSNILGLVLGSIGFIIFLDIKMIHFTSYASQIFRFAMFSILVMYIFTLFYVFPTYIKLRASTGKTIKTACILGVSNLFRSMGVFLAISLLAIISMSIPILFILCLSSLISYILMQNSHQIFKKLHHHSIIHHREQGKTKNTLISIDT